MNCKQENMLTPRCRFDINLEDNSGSITATITGKEGEKLLPLSAEEIYALASTENEWEPTQSDQIRLNENWFRIQVKKSFSRTSHVLYRKRKCPVFSPSTIHSGTNHG